MNGLFSQSQVLRTRTAFPVGDVVVVGDDVGDVVGDVVVGDPVVDNVGT